MRLLCKVCGLGCSGNKQALVDRLEAFDEHGPVWDQKKRHIHIPIFRKKSDPSIFLGKEVTVENYFDLIFPQQLIELLVVETNRCADQKLAHPFTASSSNIFLEQLTVKSRELFWVHSFTWVCVLLAI